MGGCKVIKWLNWCLGVPLFTFLLCKDCDGVYFLLHELLHEQCFQGQATSMQGEILHIIMKSDNEFCISGVICIMHRVGQYTYIYAYMYSIWQIGFTVMCLGLPVQLFYSIKLCILHKKLITILIVYIYMYPIFVSFRTNCMESMIFFIHICFFYKN